MKRLCSLAKGWRHTLKIQKYLVLVKLCSNKTSKTALYTTIKVIGYFNFQLHMVKCN